MPNALPPADHEYQLPCAEAVLAGTLALMTGYAQAREEHLCAPMARKILANRSLLADYAWLSPQFQAMLRNLRSHWHELQAGESIALDHGEGCASHLIPPRVH